MALCLTHLLEAALLVLNALAILNDRRLLRRWGMDRPVFGEGLKNQMAMLLYAVRTYLRLPLVVLNLAVIIFELILG